MRTLAILKEENEEVLERYELVKERVAELAREQEMPVAAKYREYFKRVAEFAVMLTEAADAVLDGTLRTRSLEELQQQNHQLYQDILPEQYETSYANPAYAVKKLGKTYGKLLSVVYSELRSEIAYAFEGRLFEVTVALELFVEIYNCFELEGAYTRKEVREALYYYIHDYMADFKLHRTRDTQDPTYTFAEDIIMESDLSDPRYLYYFGEYISENELRLVKYLNELPAETIERMADTYTDGYIRGFDVMRVDFSKKTNINIRYVIGFERVLRRAIQTFHGLGKRVMIPRVVTNLAHRTYGRKVGYFATSPNPQYEYDHKNDKGLYFDREMQKVILQAAQNAAQTYRLEYAAYAGPAVLEVFGEPEFVPVNKKEAVELSARAQKYVRELVQKQSIMMMDYLKSEETSFTIIAFPMPSIGAEFEKIFAETIRINTLDNASYVKMHQVLIDALDQGQYVHIRGKNGNRTDLKVQLHTLTDPAHQTNFENCTADVNIPAGEVFTSPQLAGTDGLLHVSRVFLNGLEYQNLEMTFADGRIKDYHCTNFATAEENQNYIRENVLHHHESLPMGEFAIGTNTIAYAMGRKYDIQSKLPILIAEKTGPHFAVGDTCYMMSEEHEVFNPDGKEIIARDNEISILRKESVDKAYFNCHTDITIPYDEIGEIAVHCADGRKIVLIAEGRFVLPGAEGLNAGLEEM